METINRSALLTYSARQMYQLVDDIDRYPEFVPYCKNAFELKRTPEEVCATLEVSSSGVTKSFSTRNLLFPGKRMQIELLDGPFKCLSGAWKFTPLAENACKIELDLEYEFSNRLASIAFARIFTPLVQSMVTAFTKRAEEIYGQTSY